jgi:N-acetylmuramoyl-L-alanine amidase
MSRPADVDVREFHDYVDVAYRDSLVRLATLDLPESPAIVSGISFEPQEALGTFRVRKGPAFLRFQHLMLNDPPRLVLDVFGAQLSALDSSPRDDSTESAGNTGVVSPSDRDSREPSSPVPSRMRQEGLVVVDAGHGAEDYGVDSHQEVLEKVLALELAQKVDRQLRVDRSPVRLTRTRDVSIALDQRAAIANFYQASVFVTIHLGSAPTPGIRGPMVYILSAPEEKGDTEPGAEESTELAALLKPWHRAQDPYIGESRRLAHLMQGELNQLFESENVVTEVPLSILEPIQAPAILIETGFLTNPRDLELLGVPEFRDRLASAIADTLSRFTRTQ